MQFDVKRDTESGISATTRTYTCAANVLENCAATENEWKIEKAPRKYTVYTQSNTAYSHSMVRQREQQNVNAGVNE